MRSVLLTSGPVDLLFKRSISCFVVHIELDSSAPSTIILSKEKSYRLGKMVSAVIIRVIRRSDTPDLTRLALFLDEFNAEIISCIDCNTSTKRDLYSSI